MVAHVSIDEYTPHQVDHILDVVESELIPAARAQMGYRGAYLLIDRAACKLICLALWDTEQDARAYEEGDAYRRYLAAVADHLSIPACGETYEVEVEA